MPQLAQKHPYINGLVGIYGPGSTTLFHSWHLPALPQIQSSQLAGISGNFHSVLLPADLPTSTSSTMQTRKPCFSKHKPPYPSPIWLFPHLRTLLFWAALMRRFFMLHSPWTLEWDMNTSRWQIQAFWYLDYKIEDSPFKKSIKLWIQASCDVSISHTGHSATFIEDRRTSKWL